MKRPNPIQLGNQAAELLKNPAFKAAIDAVRETYKEAMVATLPEQSAERDHLHKSIRCLVDVEAALTAFMQHGNMTSLMNAKKEKAKK